MDELLKLLRPEVLGAMVLCPVVLQIIRGKFPVFVAAHAAVVNFLVVAGVTGWAMRGELSPLTVSAGVLVLTQVAVAWLVSDMWFRGAVQPVSNSSNPVIPQGGTK